MQTVSYGTVYNSIGKDTHKYVSLLIANIPLFIINFTRIQTIDYKIRRYNQTAIHRFNCKKGKKKLMKMLCTYQSCQCFKSILHEYQYLGECTMSAHDPILLKQ